MNDDYLWTRAGTPDPEIQRLEQLLAPRAWPAARQPRTLPRALPRARSRWRRAGLALAASLLLCALAGAAWLQYRLAWPEGAAWRIARVQGAVQGLGADAAALEPGAELSTGSDGEVRLQVARIGEIQLAPESRLRLVQTRSGHHRVGLLHGRMQVRVWAPPMQFGVELPGAQLWDLGCAFELMSDREGQGTLTVHSGWVLLERGASEVLVPQGAQVALIAGSAAGTPYDLRASQAFRAALAAFDQQPAGAAPSPALAARVAAEAGEGDAISLLSLLQRHPGLAHGPVYERLRELLPGTPAPAREAVAAGATGVLQPWWDALPYPPAKRWWWHWRDALPGARE